MNFNANSSSDYPLKGGLSGGELALDICMKIFYDKKFNVQAL